MEIRIGSIGGVDHAKTTTISCLKNDILDDGKGSARQLVLYLPHEKETGRTSTVSKVHMTTNDGHYVSFVDLAGHEKYLRTTLHGLTAQNIDYAMIIVGSNMGVTKMTKEHFGVVISMRIPIFFIVTKIDICPQNVLQETLTNIDKLLQKTKRYKMSVQIETPDNVNDVLNLYRTGNFYDMCPIFLTSNKTGHNLDLLKHFIHNLPILSPYVMTVETKRQIFRIQDKFLVKGVGIVVSGHTIEGIIKRGDTLYIGPIINGHWTKATVKGIHDNFRTEVEQLYQNQSGCLALNFQDKKLKMTKYKIRKGIIMADQPYPLHRNFKAQIAVTTGHATTIGINYQPVINCKTIVQSARVCEMNQSVARCGDVVTVRFQFQYRPEYLNVGDIFIFREGNLRGIGKIAELLPDNLPTPPSKQSMTRRARRRERLQILHQQRQTDNPETPSDQPPSYQPPSDQTDNKKTPSDQLQS